MPSNPETVEGWDGYPPDRRDFQFHWIQVSPAVRDVMSWCDGQWRSERFGTSRPSSARQWRYLCPIQEPITDAE